MFLKLTNAAKEHDGKALFLHSRYIVSVFPVTISEEGKEIDVTVIYSALKEAWNVKESMEEVLAMLEKAQS